MALKTNKSFTKRIKITRTGKLVARRAGQNHFNAKERQTGRLSRRKEEALTLTKKTLQRYIHTASH